MVQQVQALAEGAHSLMQSLRELSHQPQTGREGQGVVAMVKQLASATTTVALKVKGVATAVAGTGQDDSQYGKWDIRIICTCMIHTSKCCSSGEIIITQSFIAFAKH